MGVEWGGKGSELPIKKPSSERIGRFMLNTDVFEVPLAVDAVEHVTEPTAAEDTSVRPPLTTSQMLDGIKPLPIVPHSARRLQ